MDNLEDSLKELINETGKETGYYEIPKVNIETIVISNKTIHENCESAWETCSESDNLLSVDKAFMQNTKSQHEKKSTTSSKSLSAVSPQILMLVLLLVGLKFLIQANYTLIDIMKTYSKKCR